MRNKREIDLYRAYMNTHRRESFFGTERGFRAFAVGLSALFVLAVTISGGYFLFRRAELQNRISALAYETDSPQLSAALREREALAEENLRLTERYDILSEQSERLSERSLYGAYRPDLFLRLEELCTGGIILTDIRAADYEFTPEFTAADAAAIPNFVSRLREEGLFSEIIYSGYTESGGSFDFTLICRLSDETGGAEP